MCLKTVLTLDIYEIVKCSDGVKVYLIKMKNNRVISQYVWWLCLPFFRLMGESVM